MMKWCMGAGRTWEGADKVTGYICIAWQSPQLEKSLVIPLVSKTFASLIEKITMGTVSNGSATAAWISQISSTACSIPLRPGHISAQG